MYNNYFKLCIYFKITCLYVKLNNIDIYIKMVILMWLDTVKYKQTQKKISKI